MFVIFDVRDEHPIESRYDTTSLVRRPTGTGSLAEVRSDRVDERDLLGTERVGDDREVRERRVPKRGRVELYQVLRQK